jgi:hypothetical protein
MGVLHPVQGISLVLRSVKNARQSSHRRSGGRISRRRLRRPRFRSLGPPGTPAISPGVAVGARAPTGPEVSITADETGSVACGTPPAGDAVEMLAPESSLGGKPLRPSPAAVPISDSVSRSDFSTGLTPAASCCAAVHVQVPGQCSVLHGTCCSSSSPISLSHSAQ